MGENAGREWALKFAEYDELKALVALSHSLDETPPHSEAPRNGWASVILDALRGEGEYYDTDCAAFVETHMGNTEPSLEYVQSFVYGALDVFAKV